MSENNKKPSSSSSPVVAPTLPPELIEPIQPIEPRSSSSLQTNKIITVVSSLPSMSSCIGSFTEFLEEHKKSSIEPQDFVKNQQQSFSFSPAQIDYTNHKYLGCSSIEDYELTDKLGEGTFGEVHKGIHKKTKTVVALKRILMHNEKEGIPLTAIREIKILRQLSHQNIVTLSDMAISYNHEGQGTPPIYMVFPYMDHDLAGLIENRSVIFSAPQIKCYMKQNKILTGCVVTRWYRAPELLLGERQYTTAIDMWAIGCVFGEILMKTPILMGNSDINQLEQIFKLCGSPTEEDWPSFKKLPVASDIAFPDFPRVVFHEFEPRFGTLAAELIDKLLVLDPEKRLSAYEALEHDYFWTSPLPAEPSDIPKYESSHEYNCRKAKDRRKQHRAHVKNDKDRPTRNNNNGQPGGNEPRHRINPSTNRKRVAPANDDGGPKRRCETRTIHPLPEKPGAIAKVSGGSIQKLNKRK
ncbi:6295_t:CDS:2 [Entrophospora sp. SA101]|nr:6295_t:CDS:2 [Entrophospora sp. SA101]